MTLAHPLQWPIPQPRAKRREKSRFQVTLAAARDDLYRELALLGASQVTISSNAALNLNGTVSARQPWVADVGVALYFTRGGREMCIACDRWDTIGDNIRAIGLSIAAIRGLERWGTSQMVDAAFAGFAALPAAIAGESWWTVLGVAPDADLETIEAARLRLVRRHHPDAGGDHEEFERVQAAYEQAAAAREA